MADRDDDERAPRIEIDPDAPPTEEEALASSRLRDALEKRRVTTGADDAQADALAVVDALRAAWDPDPLATEDHDQLVDDAPASAEELRLAAELATGKPADVVASLKAAWSPRELDVEEHRAILGRIIGVDPLAKVAPATSNVVPFGRRPGSFVRFATAGGALALAASVVLWIVSQGSRTAEAPLAHARSTQPLFAEPFKAGETSARIDKIALARASDYRDNRFAKWGVR